MPFPKVAHPIPEVPKLESVTAQGSMDQGPNWGQTGPHRGPWIRPGQLINQRLSRLAKSPGNSLQRNYEK